MNPMSTDTPVIEIRDLVRRYGRTDAVNGLSLRVAPGRCYGFFGRNGAGKTTTIKCLLNLLRPTSGEARVFGMDPAKHEVPVKARLAYVPDNVACYDDPDQVLDDVRRSARPGDLVLFKGSRVAGLERLAEALR